MRLLITFSLILLSGTAARAHLGHMGELAGHSHWIALGAGLIAAALAAALGKRNLQEAEKQDNSETEEETEEAAAGA